MCVCVRERKLSRLHANFQHFVYDLISKHYLVFIPSALNRKFAISLNNTMYASTIFWLSTLFFARTHYTYVQYTEWKVRQYSRTKHYITYFIFLFSMFFPVPIVLFHSFFLPFHCPCYVG